MAHDKIIIASRRSFPGVYQGGFLKRARSQPIVGLAAGNRSRREDVEKRPRRGRSRDSDGPVSRRSRLLNLCARRQRSSEQLGLTARVARNRPRPDNPSVHDTRQPFPDCGRSRVIFKTTAMTKVALPPPRCLRASGVKRLIDGVKKRKKKKNDTNEISRTAGYDL